MTSWIDDLRMDFDDVEVFLAGNSEDSLNTLVLKGGDEKIRTSDHARSPKPERRTHVAGRSPHTGVPT